MPPKAHAVLGASSAERWLNCTPSAGLTKDMPDEGSEYAAEGTLAHEIGELKLRKRFTLMKPSRFKAAHEKLKASPLYAAEMEHCTDMYVDAVNDAYMSFPAEPYAVFEQQVDYSQWVPEGFGTADCLLIGAGILWVFDYKHGKGVAVAAEDNPQMKLYALGAWSRYCFMYDVRRVRWTIVQPRNGGISETQELTIEDLLEWAQSYVKPRAALAAEGKGEYCAGDHCRFCKAKATCRARSDYFLAMEGFSQAPPALLTDAELGGVLARAKAVQSWLSDVEEYVLSYLLNGGTVPGWKAVEGRANRAWTDAEKALAAVKKAGTPEEMLYKRVPLTLAQVEELVGKKAFAAFAEFVTVPPGKPTLAAESDKRPAITNKPSAEEDFAPTADPAAPAATPTVPPTNPGEGDPYMHPSR